MSSMYVTTFMWHYVYAMSPHSLCHECGDMPDMYNNMRDLIYHGMYGCTCMSLKNGQLFQIFIIEKSYLLFSVE